jgi:hypothetical protein
VVHSVTAPAGPAKDSPSAADLRDLGEPSQDGERISVTDVNGTVARFEMTYSPPTTERVRFLAPLAARIPSMAYLALAAAASGVIFVAYSSGPNTRLFQWIVMGDRTRPISAEILAVIVLVSAVATVIRAHMRGVILSGDWIEARYLLAFGVPRARRWGWPQVSRLVLDHGAIERGSGSPAGFELSDGAFERLPEVAQPKKLRDLLVSHAVKRKIQVTALER